MKKATKIKLVALVSDFRLLPTVEFEYFMRQRWLPFLNSLDKEEQQEALELFLKDQLSTLSSIVAYLPEMGETTYRAILPSLDQLASLSFQKEPHLAAA